MSRLRDQPLIRRAIRRRGQPSAADFARELGPASLAQDMQSATKLLYERLGEDDVREVERLVSLTPSLPDLAGFANDIDARRQLVLNYGTWLGVEAVSEKTGLVPDQPPEHVHAMARGPLAAAGGLYEADLLVNALRSAAADFEQLRTGLDFGCSSGRVVRVMAAAFRGIRWLGCDPNETAIEWARQHLPGIEFFVNPQQPPLAIEKTSLDLVYAISIWSHFAPELGLHWFDEMHRLIRPGGYLVCTTHGVQSIAFNATNGLRTPEQSEAIEHALYQRGWWYAAEFGDAGDDGVLNPQWGTAFLSPEWVLTKLCPQWRVLEFASGRNQSNQDVYVLQRA